MTTNPHPHDHDHDHQGQQRNDGDGRGDGTGLRDGSWRTPRVGSGQRLREHARRAPQVRGLRLDIDGRLTEITYRGRAHHALRAPLGVRDQDAPGGVGLEALDDNLTMWFDEYGAEHQRINPAASVVAAAFGRHEQVYGPVVFTGWDDGDETGAPFGGRTCDVSAAATVLLAGIAASTDPTTSTSVVDVPRQRAVEWSGLGVEVTRGPGRESFDALAWTITRDGDVARCVECGEPGSHPEHQPEALAAETSQIDPGGPVSPRRGGSAGRSGSGCRGRGARGEARWTEQARAATPVGRFEAGGPVRTHRQPPGARHVPGRAPGGGYDLSDPSGTQDDEHQDDEQGEGRGA